MLRTKKSHELAAVKGREEGAGMLAPGIHTRLIGDEADALPVERLRVHFLKSVYAGLRVAGGSGRGGRRNCLRRSCWRKGQERDENGAERRAERDILGAQKKSCHWQSIVRQKGVCYIQ